VQEVMDWKPPKSVHQIRSFLGLAGYYRCWRCKSVNLAMSLPSMLA
jgi:hypothetical protein